ncbi:Flp family type IVb pilin [Ralstonia sp. UBA689]|uniref:Flp family type IVb pilin n=1 Tax=Ralstonia sp. UBA689 TaxID=1947373 RepID=UPI0025D41D66|nr:Flp family type IVb pilin [Ralstonia sp. UBA689]
MKDVILKFLRDEQGATAIEYGLLAGLIAAVIAVTVGKLGGLLETTFVTICNSIKAGTC